MKELKYLIIVLPILFYAWYWTIAEKLNGDFSEDGDFYMVAGILAIATGWVVADIINRLKK